ncbi:MAG: PIN domain-containing protein [Chloroflexota bacterium]|nr:PIN domain-containing protein [Chloroflexota bacterium]
MKDLAHVPSGTRIFVDASVLALHFTGHPELGPPCRDFLERCASREIEGYTSVIAASETIHRVIVNEARTNLGFATSPETVNYLKRHPEAVKGLRQHLAVASEIYRLGVEILPVSYKTLHRSKQVRQQYGLLTNDSLIVAVMQRHRLRHLATHDRDFGRVSTLHVWGPIPLPS